MSRRGEAVASAAAGTGSGAGAGSATSVEVAGSGRAGDASAAGSGISVEAAGSGGGVAARREGIVRVLDASGRVEVGELAQRLGVAEETVRRDLRALEQAGRLRRAHGGAIANERGTQHPDADAGDSNHDAVRAVHGLAAAVAGCIADGDAVYLDGGAVGEALAGMLSSGVGADERARAGASAVPVAGRHADARAGASAVAAPGASGGVDTGASGGADAAGGSPARAASGVRIVTASVPVALAAALAADPPEVHLLGGQVGGDGRASGQWTRDLAGGLRLDVAVLAADGLGPDGRLLAATADGAALSAAVVGAARRVVLIGDPERLGDGGRGMVAYAPLSAVHQVVLGASASPALTALLADAGVELITAAPGRGPDPDARARSDERTATDGEVAA